MALARSVGGERAEIASLSAQLTEAREKADRLIADHCQHTETLQGTTAAAVHASGSSACIILIMCVHVPV